MKKIYIQLFIITIGILLSIASFNGVKKYFNKKDVKNINYIIAYNNFSNVSFASNIITTTKVENVEEIKEITTTTTSKITTKITSKTTLKNSTTNSTTETTKTTRQSETTTMNPIENYEKPIIETPKIENDEKVIYDGLTLSELTDKLNKNLKSTLTNTGHYFANYYVKTGLDPYLAVAIVLQETGCKWTCSKLVRECNNIGGMKGKPNCNGGSYMKYDTLEEGINGYLNMLYNNYYQKGLTTPELMNPKYATSKEWSVNVNKYIENIKAS